MLNFLAAVIAMSIPGGGITTPPNDLLSQRAESAVGALRRGLTSIDSAEQVRVAVKAPPLVASNSGTSPGSGFTPNNVITVNTQAAGCTSATGCTTAQGNLCSTQAWGPIACASTASLNAGCTSSGCPFTTTQGCANSTFYPSCYYTVINYPGCVPTAGVSCPPTSGLSCNKNPTSQSTSYTCSAASQGVGGTCAAGCVVLTDVQYDCSTKSDWCAKYTLASTCMVGNNCVSNNPTYNVDCLVTYKNAAGCTSAGACAGTANGGVGINCIASAVGSGVDCGNPFPVQSVGGQWVPISGPAGVASLLALSMGLGLLRKLGIA